MLLHFGHLNFITSLQAACLFLSDAPPLTSTLDIDCQNDNRDIRNTQSVAQESPPSLSRSDAGLGWYFVILLNVFPSLPFDRSPFCLVGCIPSVYESHFTCPYRHSNEDAFNLLRILSGDCPFVWYWRVRVLTFSFGDRLSGSTSIAILPPTSIYLRLSWSGFPTPTPQTLPKRSSVYPTCKPVRV